MIDQSISMLLDYGVSGVFIIFLIWLYKNGMQRIMARLDQIEIKIELLFSEQRLQDKEQQDKLFKVITEKER